MGRNNHKNIESAIRLSLIDVMYGVVIAYGFTFFDKANTFTAYFRFFFAYAIFIIDWLFVHRLYWRWSGYHNYFLILDLIVVFTISRLLHTSVEQTPSYLLWLSILFMVYIVWDIISRIKNLSSDYDWRYSISGDLLAAVVFLIGWILSLKEVVSQDNTLLNVGIVIVYFIAFLLWFKKVPE